MSFKNYFNWCALLNMFIIYSSTCEPTNRIVLKTLLPHNMNTHDIKEHTIFACETYFNQNTILLSKTHRSTHIDKEEYYTWFQKFYELFSCTKNTEFIIAAYEDDELVGSLYCQEHTPFDIYTRTTVSDHYYYVYLLFVSQSHQRRGIAKKLLTHLNVINNTNNTPLPIFLYTHAANTNARALYENTGFILVKDEDHEDGLNSRAAQLLRKEDKLSLPLVAYRKN